MDQTATLAPKPKKISTRRDKARESRRIKRQKNRYEKSHLKKASDISENSVPYPTPGNFIMSQHALHDQPPQFSQFSASNQQWFPNQPTIFNQTGYFGDWSKGMPYPTWGHEELNSVASAGPAAVAGFTKARLNPLAKPWTPSATWGSFA